MDLEAKFREFVLSSSRNECVDKMDPGLFTARKADYLLTHRGIVAEVKHLTENRAVTINQRLNELANSDPSFPQFFGDVPVEEIIRRHKDSHKFRNWICNFAARTLDDLIRSAHHQIAATQDALKIPRSIGLLVLLNEGVQLYDNDFVYQEVSRILGKRKDGRLERGHVEAVWFINESGRHRRSVWSTITIGPGARNGHIEKILNMLHVRWSSYNAYAMHRIKP